MKLPLNVVFAAAMGRSRRVFVDRLEAGVLGQDAAERTREKDSQHRAELHELFEPL